MKVILLKDVAKVGRKHDIKEVSAGYASNFLFPHKFAVPATKEAENAILKKKHEIDAERKVKNDLLVKSLMTLDGAKVTIKAKGDEKGHLYAKIHTKEIVKAIKEQLSLEVGEDLITLSEPIKEAGKTTISVSAEGAKAKFDVFVETL